MKRKIRWDRVIGIIVCGLIIVYMVLLIIELYKMINKPEFTVLGTLNRPATVNLEPCVYEEPEEEEFTFYESKEEYIQQEIVETSAEENGLVSLGIFTLTAYDDCEQCQGEWVGTTALGVAPTVNNTIAVDPNVIPLGSYVWINGVRYHAEDTGGAIKGNKIDIFVDSHEETYSSFCNGEAEVFLEVQ